MADIEASFRSLRELAPDHDVISLWPALTINHDLKPYYIERGNGQRHDRVTVQINQPEMVLVKPEQGNGIGVLIIAGGGYTRVAFDKEGMDTARWLANAGYTSFVLNYRLPGEGHPLGNETPLADAQRAMRIMRSRGESLQLNTFMVVGFSAGGHLAGWLATRSDEASYPKQDAIDDLSAGPDLAALLYPVISLDENITHMGSRQQFTARLANKVLHPDYSVETMVTESTPPCFLLHASDDPAVKAENSLVMWQALRAKGIPVEMHLVEKGGHGFGIHYTGNLPVSDWPNWLDRWVNDRLKK